MTEDELRALDKMLDRDFNEGNDALPEPEPEASAWPVYSICSSCEGSGYTPEGKDCDLCGGMGLIEEGKEP